MTLPDRFESISINRFDQALRIASQPAETPSEEGAAEVPPGALEGLRVS